MYTSFLVVALAGSVAASYSPSPSWQPSYGEARAVGQAEKKPVAVFLGEGPGGHGKVCLDGRLSAEVEKCLGESYVCVYVDVTTEEGRKLAKDFGITQGAGLVLSDRTGSLQAFYHDGLISDADLSRCVKRFADPAVVVRSTATNSTLQVSNYPPEGAGQPYGSLQGYNPGMTFGGVSGGG
jgi:hypothetical protein